MNTTPNALKDLYEALGGEASEVAELSQTVDVLNAIAEKYKGEGNASVIPDAIENIAAVADNIGSKPSGTISITENGTIDVTDYANADVNVQPSSIRLTVTNSLSLPIFIVGLEDDFISKSVNAGQTKTFTCYGNNGSSFDRMLNFAFQTEYDLTNVTVKKDGATTEYRKFTNSAQPYSFIIKIHEIPAQDFTIVVSTT